MHWDLIPHARIILLLPEAERAADGVRWCDGPFEGMVEMRRSVKAESMLIWRLN